jgi:hypothetical protein
METQREHSEGGPRLRWFIIPLLLFTLAGLFIAYRQLLAARVNARVAEIRDAGYPTNLAELDAWYAIAAGVPNAADIYTKAFALLVKDEQLEYGLPWVGRDTLAPDEPLSVPTKEAIRRLLDVNREALDLLAEGAKIRHCRYPVNLNQGFGVLLPHLTNIRHGGRLLLLQAILHAEDGQTELAVQSVLNSLQLSGSIEKEPVLISQLVRMAASTYAVCSIEHVLSRSSVTEEGLARLRMALAEARRQGSFLPSLVGERTMGLSVFRMEPDELALVVGMGNTGTGTRALYFLYRASGLADAEALTFLDLWDQMLDAAQGPVTSRLPDANAVENRAQQLPRYKVITRMLFPAIARSIAHDLRQQALFSFADAGLAVEQFRLKYWRTPEFLDELVPEFLDAVPMDPFDGAPVRFRRLERGYVLYSVGMNETGDGGKGSPQGDDVTFHVAR